VRGANLAWRFDLSLWQRPLPHDVRGDDSPAGLLPWFCGPGRARSLQSRAIVGANGLRAPLYLENYEGYAEQILHSFKFGPDDAFIVISTSGIRPVVVEVAEGAQRRGLPVIAIVSKSHCEQAKPAHSSGKKLIDCADLVIDNQCPPGDCIVELEGLEWRTGPVSTLTGATIINMIRCATAEALLARGVKPVLLPSHQFVGNASAAGQLEAFYEAYRKSLKHLFE
jgi:uncharacterized phosphosugar-binding protein